MRRQTPPSVPRFRVISHRAVCSPEETSLLGHARYHIDSQACSRPRDQRVDSLPQWTGSVEDAWLGRVALGDRLSVPVSTDPMVRDFYSRPGRSATRSQRSSDDAESPRKLLGGRAPEAP